MKKLMNSCIMRGLKKAFSVSLHSLGIILLISIVLSFTDVPFNLYYWLGTHNCELTKKPDYIVLLSGAGMPSPDGLMKTYFAASAYAEVPESKIIIAMPSDSCLKEKSPELLIAQELYLKGIDSSKIIFERSGISTHSQAINIAGMFSDMAVDTLGIRIVTTPEHTYRSVHTFRNAGFKYVGGTAAFEKAIKESNLIKEETPLKENKSLNLRYNMWSYLKYEITVMREFCAIAYYELQGWM